MKRSWIIGTILLIMMLVFQDAMASAVPKEKKKSKDEKSQGSKVACNVSMLIDAKRSEITGDKDKAEELFTQYIEKYPDDPVAYFELARIVAGKKKFDEAVALSERSVKLDPSNKWYLLFYADVLQLTGKYKEAITIYERLAEKEPDNLDYYYQLAALYLALEKYGDAVKVYDKIEQYAGISEDISIQKEKIYLILNDLPKAEHELQALADAYPDEVKYLGILAEFYMNNKMQDKGLATYERIEKADPGNPYVHVDGRLLPQGREQGEGL
jgi:predicted Zn-dependent protease